MSGKRILVVDDEESIRDFINTVLLEEGYDVKIATNGKEALDLLEGDYEPDLILLDMRMPIMNGWDFSQAYHQLALKHAPIIVLTASTDAAARGSQINSVNALAKPFDLEELLVAVEKYLHKPA